MADNIFFRITFTSKVICIGERIKKGTFRPCLDVLPCSTVTGALINLFGWIEPTAEEPFPICAVGGELKGTRETLTFAPADIGVGVSKIPLTIEYLSDAEGEFFVKKTTAIPDLETLKTKLGSGPFRMGAFKSKGFGLCELREPKPHEGRLIEKEGTLKTRLYADPPFLAAFGIQEILKPRYGYLFRKETMDDGYYQKSVFEKSRILGGFDFLMEENDGRAPRIAG